MHEKLIGITKKKMEDGSLTEEELAALQGEINESSKNWQNMSKETETRRKDIERLMKPALKFSQKEETFVAVLKDLEKKSKDLIVNTEDYHEAEKILKDSKVGYWYGISKPHLANEEIV